MSSAKEEGSEPPVASVVTSLTAASPKRADLRQEKKERNNMHNG